MARATFVKSARKDILGYDGEVKIAKGESYYWWKFRFGGKVTSKTRPRRSQLTQSAFYGAMYDIEDRISELSADSPSDLESDVQDIVSELEGLRDETQDSLSNMPEQLQEAPTGELLQSRIESVENIISELECIDFSDFNEDEPDGTATDEQRTDYEAALSTWLEDKIGEVQNISIDYE